MADPAFDLPALRARDEAAWAALQAAWFRRIYFFVKRQVGDHQTAEDLAQETFLGALRAIDDYDPAFTPEQFLFGIARHRVVDHLRRRRSARVGLAPQGAPDASTAWLDAAADDDAPRPDEAVVGGEDEARRRRVLADILRQFVGELWQAGEFDKLTVLEFLFVLGGRNKDAAQRFGYADEKHVAGVKFRAIERLRALARQRDPNHSLFGGLWGPGAR